MQRPAIVSVVTACSTAISVCERGRQHQRALLLSRAMLRLAIGPGVVAYGAAHGGCESSSSPSRHYISCERGGARPVRRMWATVASPSLYTTAGRLGMAAIACSRALWRQRHATPALWLQRPRLSASAHAKRPAVKGAGCQGGRSAPLRRVCGVLGTRLGIRCNVAGLALWLGVVIPPEQAVELRGKRAGGAPLLGYSCGAQRRATMPGMFAG